MKTLIKYDTLTNSINIDSFSLIYKNEATRTPTIDFGDQYTNQLYYTLKFTRTVKLQISIKIMS